MPAAVTAAAFFRCPHGHPAIPVDLHQPLLLFALPYDSIMSSPPSPESKFDALAATLVGQLYLQLLGRPPDEAGQAHYIRRLKAGYLPEDVVYDICHSEEFKSRAVSSDHHRRALLRARFLRIPFIGLAIRRKYFQPFHASEYQNWIDSFLGPTTPINETASTLQAIDRAPIGTPYSQDNSTLKKHSTPSPAPMDNEAPATAPDSRRAIQMTPNKRIADGRYAGLVPYSEHLHGSLDVIVCVHNALADVQRCLKSVIAHSPYNISLILVDDGSQPPTADYLTNFARVHKCLLIRNEAARGYTFAANQGLRASRSDFCVLLNSDTIVTAQWLQKMVACARSYPCIGIVGPLSNTASWQSIPDIASGADWATNPLPDGYTVDSYARAVEGNSLRLYPRMSFLNGFCLLLTRKLIEDIGYFDEIHFGAGYGEENDYCLRARAAGWQLALADDTYVFHAQSKSYSHERRKALSEAAGQKLASLHTPETVERGVQQCKDDLCLVSLRAHARYFVERAKLRESARRRWAGLRILFVLPVMHSGGGSNVVITEALALQKMGIVVFLANLSAHRSAFEQSYPDLGIPTIYVDDPSGIPDLASNFDALIATANQSAHWLAPLDQDRRVRLGYYVQDFEPLFYDPASSGYHSALASYTTSSRMQLFTKTVWNKREVLLNTGRAPRIVGPSYDVDLFRPQHQQDLESHPGPLRITAMIRASSPRRNPVGTLAVLRNLRQKYGDSIRISIFGHDDSPILDDGASVLNSLERYGHLRPTQIARLLSETDIFLDLSHYQAMGLTAMEAMSCGAAVVVPLAGGANSYAINGLNSLMLDTTNQMGVAQAVSTLIDDPQRLAQLRRRGMQDVAKFHPEASAVKILESLYAQ